jgi:hypothetical protein
MPVDELPEQHSHERAPFRATGLEGCFGVTFSSMRRGYSRDEPVFFDAAVVVVLGEGP